MTWPSFRRSITTLASLALTGLLLAVALLPFLALLGAGVWAATLFLYEIVGIGGLFRAGNFPAVMRSLTTLDLAGRTGFFSASYFMLLLALVVLLTGLLGRRRQHLFLIPGIVLTVLGLGGFVIAAQFLFASLHLAPLATGISRRLIVGYIAVDAVALAALLADLGPSRRALRRRALGRERLLTQQRAAIAGSVPVPVRPGSMTTPAVQPAQAIATDKSTDESDDGAAPAPQAELTAQVPTTTPAPVDADAETEGTPTAQPPIGNPAPVETQAAPAETSPPVEVPPDESAVVAQPVDSRGRPA